MARLAVDGTKSIYFEDLGGAGRALIMVHGWGMDNRCWDGVILPLLAAGHRVITMDHRGCGRSDHDFADVSIAANAAGQRDSCCWRFPRRQLRIVDHRFIRCDFCGCSGGRIAVHATFILSHEQQLCEPN